MRQVTRFDIRKDLDALEEAMQTEKFLKTDDPSISIMTFIEQTSQAMGAIKHLYARGAQDRNGIVDEVKKHVEDVKASCDALLQSLHNNAGDPEDDNSQLPSDAET